jgi:hypothetical protein
MRAFDYNTEKAALAKHRRLTPLRFPYGDQANGFKAALMFRQSVASMSNTSPVGPPRDECRSGTRDPDGRVPAHYRRGERGRHTVAGVTVHEALNVHTETATTLLHSGASGSLTTDEDNEWKRVQLSAARSARPCATISAFASVNPRPSASAREAAPAGRSPSAAATSTAASTSTRIPKLALPGIQLMSTMPGASTRAERVMTTLMCGVAAARARRAVSTSPWDCVGFKRGGRWMGDVP